MLGKSSTGLFSYFLASFLGWVVLFYFSLSAMAFSSSVASSLATLSNNFSLSLSSSIFLSIYSGDEGARTPNFSNIVSTLKGIWNFSSFFGYCCFFLFFLLCFFSGCYYSLLFFGCNISTFYFFHWPSFSLAAIYAWSTLTSFLPSASWALSLSLKLLR